MVRPASAHDWVSLVQWSLRSGSELMSGENISSNLAKSVFKLASNEPSICGSVVDFDSSLVVGIGEAVDVVANGLDT